MKLRDAWQYQSIPVYWVWLCLPSHTRQSIVSIARKNLRTKGLDGDEAIELFAKKHWHEYTPVEQNEFHKIMLSMASTRREMIKEATPKAKAIT